MKKNIFFAFLLLCFSVSAQQYGIKTYSLEDGLVQSQVWCLYQDTKGYLWIGTASGLSRFDGISFKKYTSKNGFTNNKVYSILEDNSGNLWAATDGDGIFIFNGFSFTKKVTAENGLPSNNVVKLFRDSRGSIWISTSKGVCMYNGKDFLRDKNLDAVKKLVLSIAEDAEENIWLGTIGDGLYRYDHRQLSHYTTADGLSSNIVGDILKDKAGNLWLATSSGVIKYENKSFVKVLLPGSLGSIPVYTLKEDKDGNIWMGTKASGIIIYNPHADAARLAPLNSTPCQVISTNEELSSNYVSALLQDREENIWAGTYGGGINKIRIKAFVPFSSATALSEETVWSLLQSADGATWFGTDNGLNILSGNGSTAFRKDYFNNIPVWSLLEDTKGNIWAGTRGSGVIQFDGKNFIKKTVTDGLCSNNIQCILEDKKGNLWFGSKENGVSRYDGKSFLNFSIQGGLPSNTINSILEDMEESIWFSTGNGVSRYDGKTFKNYSQGSGLNFKEITCSAMDKDGNILFGTKGNGINIYYPSKDSFSYLTTEDGLLNDEIASLIFDDEANLWIGSISGAEKFFYKEYRQSGIIKLRHYGKEEGLTALDCVQGAILKDKNGSIWFGSLKGAFRYLAAHDKLNHTVPITEMEAVKLFNETVTDWAKYTDSVSASGLLPLSPRFPHNKNNLTFEFLGISLTDPSKVQYQYKLDGYDDKWEITTDRKAKYTNLSPGEYTFMVRAANNDGKWNEAPTVFSFVIKKPFWQEVWFYAACLLALFAGVSGIIRLRTRALLKQRAILERQVARRTEQLQIAKERAENSERIKQEFFANMSHEIRTPMNSIIGFTRLALKTGLTAEQQKFIEAIKTSGENLLVIINDILDISKMEAGKVSFEQIEFNCRNVVATVVDMLQVKAAEKNIRLYSEIDKQVPDWVMGDPVRLNQCLINLVGNAVKFTERGEVRVGINLKSEDDQSLVLEFAIRDTGIGIPENKINSIFESFTQASSDTTRKFGGTGLGLTITKKLVEMQGGLIKIQSKYGEGSIFTFTILYKKFTGVKPKQPEEKQEVLTPQSLGKLKVLLVEDNPMNQLLAKTIVNKEWGYDIDIAENGRIGVEKVEANEYHIVLMDIQMPEMDGYTATKNIRALQNGKSKIPIIAMTAHATAGEAEKCQQVGMDGYISKPFNPQMLLGKIAELLKKN